MKRICNRGSISVLRILSLLSSSSRSIVPQIRQVVSAKILHGWMMYFETILQASVCVYVCIGCWPRYLSFVFSNRSLSSVSNEKFEHFRYYWD